MASETVEAAGRPARLPWFGRGSVVLAVVAVQLAAFATAVAAGHPTAYAVFAVASAAALGWGSNGGWFGTAAATLGTVLVVGLGLPMALFVVRQEPALVADALGDAAVHRMLYLSVYGPLVAAVVSVALGTPLAYLFAKGFAGQELVESLVDLPLVVPHAVVGIIVLFGFGTGGILPQVPVLGTMFGLTVAFTFVGAPYAVNAAREAFERIDARVEYAARAHGASPFETFRRVTLPLAARGVLSGGVLAWARAVSEFGAIAVVAYSVDFFYPVAGGAVKGQHAPVFIYNVYTAEGLDGSGAVAVVLFALAAGIFLAVRWLTSGEGGLL